MFEIGQKVVWQWPKLAKPLEAEIVRKDDSLFWWVIRVEKREFFALESELRLLGKESSK